MLMGSLTPPPNPLNDVSEVLIIPRTNGTEELLDKNISDLSSLGMVRILKMLPAIIIAFGAGGTTALALHELFQKWEIIDNENAAHSMINLTTTSITCASVGLNYFTVFSRSLASKNKDHKDYPKVSRYSGTLIAFLTSVSQGFVAYLGTQHLFIGFFGTQQNTARHYIAPIFGACATISWLAFVRPTSIKNLHVLFICYQDDQEHHQESKSIIRHIFAIGGATGASMMAFYGIRQSLLLLNRSSPTNTPTFITSAATIGAFSCILGTAATYVDFIDKENTLGIYKQGNLFIKTIGYLNAFIASTTLCLLSFRGVQTFEESIGIDSSSVGSRIVAGIDAFFMATIIFFVSSKVAYLFLNAISQCISFRNFDPLRLFYNGPIQPLRTEVLSDKDESSTDTKLGGHPHLTYFFCRLNDNPSSTLSAREQPKNVSFSSTGDNPNPVSPTSPTRGQPGNVSFSSTEDHSKNEKPPPQSTSLSTPTSPPAQRRREVSFQSANNPTPTDGPRRAYSIDDITRPPCAPANKEPPSTLLYLPTLFSAQTKGSHTSDDSKRARVPANKKSPSPLLYTPTSPPKNDSFSSSLARHAHTPLDELDHSQELLLTPLTRGTN